MKFKTGDKVIIDEKYIENNNSYYSNRDLMLEHIDDGNKPMKIIYAVNGSDIVLIDKLTKHNFRQFVKDSELKRYYEENSIKKLR